MRIRGILKGVLGVVLSASIALVSSGSAYAVTASGAIAPGIDVSKYNGNINWQAVANSGIKFAFVRVGNPLTGLDPKFVANMNGASAAGLRTGVYYYSHAVTVEQALAEAAQTLAWIKDYPVSFPVVYDVEAGGQKVLPAATMQAIVDTYCTVIEAAGYRPVVYSNKSFYKSKLSGSKWDRWVAQYGSSCDMNNVAFWQYSSKGSIPGVPTRVDLDFQYKDYSALIVRDGFVPYAGGLRVYLNWKMQKGYVPVGDGAFYCDPATGILQTGWIILPDGTTYYGEPKASGILAKGIYVINDVMYYFDNKGALQRNTKFTVDGLNFVTNADGIILPAEGL